MTKHIAPILAGLAAFSAAACSVTSEIPNRLPHEQHRITVREVREMVQIPVAPGQSDLRASDEYALRVAAEDFRHAGNGRVAIAVPAGQGDEDAARLIGAQARAALSRAGVDFRSIQTARYDARAEESAVVVVSYTRVVAEGPRCGESWDDIGHTLDGNPTMNFGCARQANLAAMIADPRDLINPRAVDPSDAGRRVEQMQAYRRGEPTAASRAETESASVSQAIQ